MHATQSAVRKSPCLAFRGNVCLRKPVRRAPVAVRAVVDDEEIDDKVAQFLEQQDMTERGLEKKSELTEVLGQDEVDDEQAKAYCRDIVRVLRMLKEKRDMELREAKLVVAIDDPRNDDARKMGIEDSAGVSRDEMAVALESVAAGQLPNDRIALRVLHAEMVNWPFLDSDEKSAKYTNFEAKADGVDEEEENPGFRDPQKVITGRDPKEKPQGIADILPEWVGYSGLYVITLVPVFILGTTVAVLFFSSLK